MITYIRWGVLPTVEQLGKTTHSDAQTLWSFMQSICSHCKECLEPLSIWGEDGGVGGLRNFPNPWLDCAHKHIHTSSIDRHCVCVQEYRMVLQDNCTIIETKIFNLCLL